MGGTADNKACGDACAAFDGCNAAVRVDTNGACFFKTVDLDATAPVPVLGLTTLLLCNDDADPSVEPPIARPIPGTVPA